jgi:replicative DNA helicase
MRGGLDLVIVDHAQIVASERVKGDKDRGRYLELRLIAEGLREMAKEWRIPVVLMAQMNPVSAERKNKRPKLSEIRESNDMGNTADAAVLIYQERNENTDEIDSTELIVAKNRHGRRGTVVVGFEGALHNFAEPTTALAPPQSDELFG